MTSTKISTAKAIALSTICLSTFCLVSVAGSLSFLPSANAQNYGLGLSKSAGSGGATRGDLPSILLLVPEDGAKTLASRPTFYWYVAPASSDAPDSKSAPEDTIKDTFEVTFILRDSNVSGKKVFEAEGKADKTGLYKFTLPEDAPELVQGKVQRWQIRWKKTSGVTSQVDVFAPIRRDDDPAMLNAISSAKNDLEKARAYAKNAYWYDAIDSYTIWLSQNPKDDVARTERNKLLQEGFKQHSAFNEEPCKLTKLQKKLDENKTAISVDFKTKTLR
ncbi:MAG: hypothetical protein DCF19_23825 [Pseudanabaena frigida]|uniref:DUF928 domain-containing protein n=1 Tax=Pseudanabaena frigida TaxID=945775 RepID=A0A2W4VRL0_9CYAN|nr:MAG: hypothetical protein DCF19_23825 [Pseudanabaena frigida]